MPLTDIVIRKAKPAEKPQRLFDGGGMYLEISPTGGIHHAGREARKVTFRITYPNTCSLKYDEVGERLRAMLERSGIEPREPAA